MSWWCEDGQDGLPAGWLSGEEANYLADLAIGKRVLELGSYLGRSTVAIARMAQVVYAVDWHRGDEGAGFKDTLNGFLQNLTRYKVADKVVPIIQRTEVVSRSGLGRFDLVFVDGAHDPSSVERDSIWALSAVNDQGIVIWHDWDMPGVRSAARQAVEFMEKSGDFQAGPRSLMGLHLG